MTSDFFFIFWPISPFLFSHIYTQHTQNANKSSTKQYLSLPFTYLLLSFLNGGSDSLDSFQFKNTTLYILFTPINSSLYLHLHCPALHSFTTFSKAWLFIYIIYNPAHSHLSSLVLILLKFYSNFATNDSSNPYNLTNFVVMIAIKPILPQTGYKFKDKNHAF